MFVDSWAAFYSIRKEREQGFDEKRRSEQSGRPFLVEAELEIKPQTELHPAPIVRVGQMQEATRAKVSVDLIELGVIEEVKVFPAEVESSLLVNRELLEEAEVEVEASR